MSWSVVEFLGPSWHIHRVATLAPFDLAVLGQRPITTLAWGASPRILASLTFKALKARSKDQNPHPYLGQPRRLNTESDACVGFAKRSIPGGG